MTVPRVLFADDSMVVRAVIRGQLAGEGYVLIEAADGDEALERIRADRPDVALLDVEMPGADGYEVLRAMRADEDLAQIPVIFLSGRVTADDVAHGLRLGAHDYLRKPVEPGELVARLTAALRTKELHDRLRRDNAHLREMAPVDPLTGTLDVRGLHRALGDLAAESRRTGAPLGGVLLDVDGLAAVNAEFGWDGGDIVLEEIAQRTSQRLRPGWVVGRCGPDEFLVLLPGVDRDGAAECARDLRAHVAVDAIVVDGVARRIGVSVGAGSVADGDGAELLSMLQHAIAADKARPAEPAAAPAPPAPDPTPAPSADEPLDRGLLLEKLRAAARG